MNQLRITTSKPQSMASLGDPLVNPSNRSTLITSVTRGNRAYLHGEIQSIAGYDIPIFLDGDMAQLDLPESDQDILVVLPSGEYKCISTLQTIWEAGAYYITLKEKKS